MADNRDGAISRIEPPAIAGAALAVVLALGLKEGPFDWWSSTVGLTLFFILLMYRDRWSQNSVTSIAFGSLRALSVIMTIGILVEYTSRRIQGSDYSPFGNVWEAPGMRSSPKQSAVPNFVIFLMWCALTLGFFVWDAVMKRKRARREERKQEDL